MDRESHIGLDRYAAEHWIASHPDSNPVGVMPLDLPFDIASVSDNVHWIPRLQTLRVSNDDGWNESSFFQLEGRLYLYRALYNALPPTDSWVWKHYDNRTKNP
mmetsp:Transcript_14148/g.32749  ORF Transcript_14148/g.32749 Transcript_14148/m.32749 type:complete len:103 (+) Transcript_14148:2-310(+)